MRRGAPLFATTVLDSNAIDHIYQFASVEEVRASLRETGFEIITERVLRVRDYDANARDPSTGHRVGVQSQLAQSACDSHEGRSAPLSSILATALGL